MADSVLRGVILFLDQIGIYDVVLPFLLVFTIVFAIFEKTKVLGTEEVDGKKYTKKNLNSMIAFVIALLVVASTHLVAIINKSLANMVLILILIVMFMLLFGAFYKEDEPVFLGGQWRSAFMVVILISIILIFFDAVGWLDDVMKFVSESAGKPWFGAIILLVVIVVFMLFIVREPTHKKEEKKTDA